MIGKKKWRGVAAFSAVALLAGMFSVIGASTAGAQGEDTGASANKVCAPAPVGDPYTIGDTVTCTAILQNTGASNATIVDMSDIAPFISLGNPSNGAPVPISCVTQGSNLILHAGDTLSPGVNCVSIFQITIPNNVSFCNSVFSDLAAITLFYPLNNLSAFAGASAQTLVVCPPQIEVTKTADNLSKVGDPVNYHIEVCNTGLVTVTKTSVVDSIIPGVDAAFGTTLTPGQCESHDFSRTVVAGDPDPLVNTVTATYHSGVLSASDFASATTDLFQPSVDVTKDCVPPLIQVGENEVCTIVVHNTSSATTPLFHNAIITDSLNGDLLAAGNPAVTSSTCGDTLATGAFCTIVTTRAVQLGDPDPLVNTVTVHYNPTGFPNDIHDTATANVNIVGPSITLQLQATALSKIGDPVTYTLTVCNTSLFPVTRNIVTGNIIGNVTPLFPATLAAGQCATASVTVNVPAGSPDPLVVNATATYSGITQQATASATGSTNLFQPSIVVSKDCSPDPIQVGQVELCTIGINNTSSADSPNLVNGTIQDTKSGNLLLAGNPAVQSSNCGTTLAVGANCTIVTARTVLVGDVSPIVNTVTAHYNPEGGFTNDITGTATDSVTIQSINKGCTPGYWKQTQHFDSWKVYSPSTTFFSVFGRHITITLSNGKTVTDPTLLQALQATGGGINALARFAAAQLLNATAFGGSADFSVAQVIAIFQDGFDPGGLTIEQAHQELAGGTGISTDNCGLN